MDELSQLRAARPPAAELSDQDRAAARDRLLAAMLADPAPRPVAPRRPRDTRLRDSALAAAVRRGARRPVAVAGRLRVAATAIVAAAAASAATALMIGLPQAPAGQRAAGGGIVPEWHTPTGLTASDILLLAANRAQDVPSPVPGPGQYLYTDTVYYAQGDSLPRVSQEDWTSWDGQHGGLTVDPNPYSYTRWPDCATHSPGVQYNGSGSPSYSLPDQAPWCPGARPYRTGMPTTMAGMIAYLRAQGRGQSPASGHSAAETAVSVLAAADGGALGNGIGAGIGYGNGDYTNATLALMYRAVATFSGIFVIGDAVNLLGQRGVGIATLEPGREFTEVIFDPVTYQLIGEDEFPLQGYYTGSGGLLGTGFHGTISATPDEATAVRQVSVVDGIGQVPASQPGPGR
jgi:hypothetical protein